MGLWGWLAENGFELVGAGGVIGSLLFTAFSVRSETKTRRISNLLAITANYRSLWTTFLEREELNRINDPTADIVKQPITPAERQFIALVMQHTHSVFRSMDDELLVSLEGFRRDVAQFFSLPIPKEVWARTKAIQNDDFVAFVESCLNWK